MTAKHQSWYSEIRRLHWFNEWYILLLKTSVFVDICHIKSLIKYVTSSLTSLVKAWVHFAKYEAIVNMLVPIRWIRTQSEYSRSLVLLAWVKLPNYNCNIKELFAHNECSHKVVELISIIFVRVLCL